MTFTAFNLASPLIQALEKENMTTPTPIQESAIVPLLEGKDVLGQAGTGTGKTIAFLLPLLQKLLKNERRDLSALILAPTRELARQIGDSLTRFTAFTNLSYAAIYGGVAHEEQIALLEEGVQILVATPGRLLDLIDRNVLSLAEIDTFVLDEADHMLDLGFQEDIRRIIGMIPVNRQSMLFSATLSEPVTQLAHSFMNQPVMVQTPSAVSASDLIDQKVYFIEKQNKHLLLLDFLRKDEVKSAIVFTKTRKSADMLHLRLQEAGLVADRLHSDRSQHARDTILEAFRQSQLPILIATDIAARGIDVSHLTHVFNYELPQEADTYIHRVGRTGRAGKEGVAITFCEPDEKGMLADIQKLMRKCIPVVENHTYATLSLKKALLGADEKIMQKASRKPYMGNKANGDFFRRQKREQRKGKQ